MPEPLLLLGGNGTLGRVIAAALLQESDCTLLLPVRPHHAPEAVRKALAEEHPDLDLDTVRRRCTLLPLPTDLMDLLPECVDSGVRGIVNCAGSVSYFDREALYAGNEALTAAALRLGKALKVRHFTYLSTAFAGGYPSGLIPETLHPEPQADPTDYTASKRACEHLVMASGLPCQILRPSVVIGDSRTGRYTGRPYGIYQLWRGFEKLLSRSWQATAHGIASAGRLQLVHQDAVAEGVVAALRDFQAGRIVHLVSDPAQLPTVHEAWQLWFDTLVQPDTVLFHPSVDQAAQAPMDRRQRVYLDFAATNLRRSTSTWTG